MNNLQCILEDINETRFEIIIDLVDFVGLLTKFLKILSPNSIYNEEWWVFVIPYERKFLLDLNNSKNPYDNTFRNPKWYTDCTSSLYVSKTLM